MKRFENEDWSGARFRMINLTGAKMNDVLLTNARFSGEIGGLVINDIEVEPLIEAEVLRRYPERTKLIASDPAGFGEALDIVDRLLERTWERARALTEDQRQQRVDEEWSVVETIRHLVFVIDAWLGRAMLAQADPFHPIALPPTFMAADTGGVDPSAAPTFEEALEVWTTRLDGLRRVVEDLTPDELERTAETVGPGYPPEGRQTKVIVALWTIFVEIWAHDRFMNRDMDTLSA